jgi:Fe-Mn family superoxide dismutase
MLSRREMLISTAGGALALSLARFSLAGQPLDLTLPALPYAYDALEPHIDAQTMEIHHTKHHQAYIDKLKAALEAEAPDWLDKPVVDMVAKWEKFPEGIRSAVRNHGGGHYNHSLFWTMMAPAGQGGEPGAGLTTALGDGLGGMEGFKKELTAKATGQFGSGWAWLVCDTDGKLSVVGTPNQDNPVTNGLVPLLGIDVWEHAYYLRYQNKRPAYIEAWLNVVNWNRVNELYAATRNG